MALPIGKSIRGGVHVVVPNNLWRKIRNRPFSATILAIIIIVPGLLYLGYTIGCIIGDVARGRGYKDRWKDAGEEFAMWLQNAVNIGVVTSALWRRVFGD